MKATVSKITNSFVILCMASLIHINAQAQASAQGDIGVNVNYKKSIQVIDLAGRELFFEKVPQRIILGDSRYIYALSILNKDQPLSNIVGMVNSLKDVNFGSYQQYQKKFPEIDDIHQVGHTSADSFSIETTLSLNADLAIFGVDGHGPNSRNRQLIDQLEKAGVQVVFIDFRNDPIVNTVKSIALLGAILDRQQQAEEFTVFYQEQLNIVTDRLDKIQSMSTDTRDGTKARPNVFLHSRVGLEDLCCETMVRGMMATLLEQVKGVNVAKERVPGSAGVLNLEYLLIHQPDIYIATAISSKSAVQYEDQHNIPPYITLGAGITEKEAQQSFIRALKHVGVSELDAIKSKRAYAIWHSFYNSPLNIVAVQVFAKWLYPQTFSDLQPRKTMEKLFERFQSTPLEGTYWLELGQKVNR